MTIPVTHPITPAQAPGALGHASTRFSLAAPRQASTRPRDLLAEAAALARDNLRALWLACGAAGLLILVF